MRTAAIIFMLFGFLSTPVLAAGDPVKGASAFIVCVTCHALEPGHNMTGPSLAGIFGRKAASNASFMRYSDALKASNLTWDASTLDAWLANPREVVPGSRMNFIVADAKTRADVIAYLEATQEADGKNKTPDLPKAKPQSLNLKNGGRASRIESMRLCKDTYFITMQNGSILKYWERDVRIKTDSSPEGPESGIPALISGGMHGDRVYVVFTDPKVISSFIKTGCEG
jgi:cytochrome c